MEEDKNCDIAITKNINMFTTTRTPFGVLFFFGEIHF